jgi:predicted alpha/beta hydrolase
MLISNIMQRQLVFIKQVNIKLAVNRTPVIVLICKDDCQEPRARIKELALYYNIPLKVIKVVEHPQNSQIRK